VGRLSEDLHASAPGINAAWKTEVDRRVEEIQAGKVQGIAGVRLIGDQRSRVSAKAH